MLSHDFYVFYFCFYIFSFLKNWLPTPLWGVFHNFFLYPSQCPGVPVSQCILHIFKIWISKFPPNLKLLGIFGSTISKCPDLIRKSTPLPTHSLSIKLKLFINHFGSPCGLTLSEFLNSAKMFLIVFHVGPKWARAEQDLSRKCSAWKDFGLWNKIWVPFPSKKYVV